MPSPLPPAGVLRVPALALALALALPAAARGQDTPSRVTLVEHRFTGAAPDSVAVMLDPDQIYRLVQSGPGDAPTLGTSRARHAFVDPAPESAASGTRVYLAYPTVRGTYWLRVAGLTPQDTAVVRIEADSAAMLVRDAQRVAQRRHRWAVGAAASIGLFSAYAVTPADEPSGGMDGEACVLIVRDGSGLCAGMAWQPRDEADLPASSSGGVTWVFIEPRFRVLRSGPVTLAATVRVAAGSVTGPDAKNPAMLAPGIAVTRAFAGDGSGRGAGLQLSASYGFITDAPEEGSARFGAGLTWLF